MNVDLNNDAVRTEHRRIRRLMRRQITANGRSGKEWITTVGAVAGAAGVSSQTIVDHLDGAHLVILLADDSMPMEAWTLEEDGE